jgi:hypothetical protein
MMLAKVFKPAGAIATTVCAVATGIAVNLSILSAGPDGAGNLAVGTQRATTTTVAPTTTSPPPPGRPARLVVRVAAPAPASTLAETRHGGSPAPTTGAPGPTGGPSSTPAPSTTSTSVPHPPQGHGVETFAVGHAGTVSAHWLSTTTIEVDAVPAPGWSVSLRSWRHERVTATFVNGERGIVWKGRVDGHHLHVEVHHFDADRDIAVVTSTPPTSTPTSDEP